MEGRARGGGREVGTEGRARGGGGRERWEPKLKSLDSWLNIQFFSVSFHCIMTGWRRVFKAIIISFFLLMGSGDSKQVLIYHLYPFGEWLGHKETYVLLSEAKVK